MFLVNSRLGLFTAASSSSEREAHHPIEASLLPKLRDNFAEFLNEGFLDHLSILYLSTCVGFGTGTRAPSVRGFSRRHGFWVFACARHNVSELRSADFPTEPPTRLLRDYHHPVPLSYPVPPYGRTVQTWYRNINLLSIDYALRPRLRSRLTLSRLALLRNPWTFGGDVSHVSFVTHASILTSHASTAGFRRRFNGMGTLPYHST